MSDADGESWLYHLPSFLDRVRSRGAHGVAASLDVDLGGVLYHHRGARVPAYDATFVWRDDRFELELDAVGPRSAWAAFDADRSWDVYLAKAPGDAAYLAWMTDDEFAAEDADEVPAKRLAVGAGRFSFGLYLHAPATWADLERQARDADAPFFLHRPTGRTMVPDADELADFDAAVPGELRGEDPPGYLGLVGAHVSTE